MYRQSATITDGPDGFPARVSEADIKIMVAGADDHNVVAVALSVLQGALTGWADLILRRRAAAGTELEE